jgi:hypothetical protein
MEEGPFRKMYEKLRSEGVISTYEDAYLGRGLSLHKGEFFKHDIRQHELRNFLRSLGIGRLRSLCHHFSSHQVADYVQFPCCDRAA